MRRSPRRTWIALALACASWVGTARAEDGPAPVQERWYGRTSLILDGVGLGLEAVAVTMLGLMPRGTGFPPWGIPLTLGLGTFVFAAPVGHQMHRHDMRALGSLSVRTYGILAFTYGALWLGGWRKPDLDRDAVPAAAIFFAGQVAFDLVDDILWANDDGPMDARAARPGTAWRPALPTLAPTPNGATLGWGGSF